MTYAITAYGEALGRFNELLSALGNSLFVEYVVLLSHAAKHRLVRVVVRRTARAYSAIRLCLTP